MSDRLRVLDALREAGPRGLHSHEIRKRGLSGHPSERAAELEREGCSIHREREYVNGRNGVRFYLLGEPPRADAGHRVGRISGSEVPAGVSQTEGANPVSGGSSDALAGSSGEPPASLFELPTERPLSAFRDAEAA